MGFRVRMVLQAIQGMSRAFSKEPQKASQGITALVSPSSSPIPSCVSFASVAVWWWDILRREASFLDARQGLG